MTEITEEKQIIVDQLLTEIKEKINNCSEQEVKDDMIFLITTLVEFVGHEQYDILDPQTPKEEVGPLFIKMIAKIAAQGITAKASGFHRKQFQTKIQNVLKLHPLLIKYSNVS